MHKRRSVEGMMTKFCRPTARRGWLIGLATLFCCAGSLPGSTQTANDYSGQVLTDTNFNGADLRGADFTGAKLNGVQFVRTNLKNADFKGASFGKGTLGSTSFVHADLAGADFTETAYATNVDFQYAKTIGSRFGGAEPGRLILGPDHDSPKAATPDTPVKPSRGNKIFVASDGADGAQCGAVFSQSCATIAVGMARCAKLGAPCSVLIGYGRYRPAKSLQLQAGISLIGGYVSGHPSLYQSSVESPGAGASVLMADSVTASLKNLILVGSAGQPGQASSVVALKNTTGVTFDNVQILAATGANVPSSPAGTAVNGEAGSPYSVSTNGAPVNGGASQCGSAAAGGASGGVLLPAVDPTSSCPFPCKWPVPDPNFPQTFIPYKGGNGQPGQSHGGMGSTPKAGDGQACAVNGPGTATPTGETGTAGATATAQAAASANRIGSFNAQSGVWSGVPGATGQQGADGGGGGGGGSGLGRAQIVQNSGGICKVNYSAGAPGGGGGSGGCGASGGTGGQMGGASLGMVLINSAPKIENHVKIVGAQGGSGGNGGNGVAGGLGGAGGAGCTGSCLLASKSLNTAGPTGPSGSGGQGGPGGASGGGAGGNGGPSVAIVLIGKSTFDASLISIYPGASGSPGMGGAGAGTAPSGADGQAGLAQPVLVLPD